MTTIRQAMRPGRRRLHRLQAVRGLVYGALAGCACTLLCLVLSFLIPVPDVWRAFLLIPAVAVLGTVAGLCWPVPEKKAAAAMDATGLKDRVTTALTLTGQSAMEEMQREDAVRALQGMDLRKLRNRPVRKQLLISAALAVLCLIAFVIPSPQQNRLRTMAAWETGRTQAAEALEPLAAEEKQSAAETPESAETRRIVKELQRDLMASTDLTDALLALGRSEERLEKLQNRTLGEKLAEAASADNSGLSALAEALSQGDMEAAAQALAGLTPEEMEKLAAAGTELSSMTASALSSAASAMSGGDAAQAAQALQEASQASAPTAAAAMQATAQVRSQLTGQGTPAANNGMGSSGNAANAGGSGNASGNGMQAGSGAGTGTTNEEQAGSGGKGNAGSGSRPPHYHEEDYERIYDPERLDIAVRDTAVSGMNGEGEDTQFQTGPENGSVSGMVPVGQYAREYREAAAAAADSRDLSAEETRIVNTYFQAILEEE